MSSRDTAHMLGQVLQQTYRIEKLIGSGGMGSVYEASHLRLSRRFAIKFLTAKLATRPKALARFRREAEITSALGHPNIVEVIDFNYTENGIPYFVMELLEGENLAVRMKRKQLSIEQIFSIFRQSASALEAAHQKGIIHRDLKPQNIFLCSRDKRNDFVKLVDFGISKVLGADNDLTHTQTLLGTPHYMAPEQAEGRAKEVDRRTDVYAMGTILYEMIAGRPPFTGKSVPSLLYKITFKEPSPFNAQRAVPKEVEAVVIKALHKRAPERWPTMDAFWRAFSDAIRKKSDSTATAPPKPPTAPKKRPTRKPDGELSETVIERPRTKGATKDSEGKKPSAIGDKTEAEAKKPDADRTEVEDRKPKVSSKKPSTKSKSGEKKKELKAPPRPQKKTATGSDKVRKKRSTNKVPIGKISKLIEKSGESEDESAKAAAGEEIAKDAATKPDQEAPAVAAKGGAKNLLAPSSDSISALWDDAGQLVGIDSPSSAEDVPSPFEVSASSSEEILSSDSASPFERSEDQSKDVMASLWDSASSRLHAHHDVDSGDRGLEPESSSPDIFGLARRSTDPFAAYSAERTKRTNPFASVERPKKTTSEEKRSEAKPRVERVERKKVEKETPDSPAAKHFEAGLGLVREGRLAEALPEWEQAASLEPDNNSYATNLRRLKRMIERERED